MSNRNWYNNFHGYGTSLLYYKRGAQYTVFARTRLLVTFFRDRRRELLFIKTRC